MDTEKNKKIYFSEFACYGIATGCSVLILLWVLQLWRADLTIPFSYTGDVTSIGLWIKSVIDDGWYLHNSFVGMPFGLEMHDFPVGATFDFLIIKFLTLFSSNYAFILNLFYLLTFPLTTITSVYVFRKLHVSQSLSIFGALLFTFVPYHILRGESHLTYAQYFLLPLIILVVLWIFEDSDIVVTRKDEKTNRTFLINRRSVFCIVVCIVIGSSELYYAFFSCFFLLFAGLYAYFARENRRNFFSALLFIALIVGIALITLSPTLVYQYENGPNPAAWQRTPADAEIYGLKIFQLLLPVQGHFIPQFAAVTGYYSNNAPLVNENSMASLGFLGSIGFLLLIWGLVFGKLPFCGKKGEQYLPLFHNLSLLNLSAILVATIGGFGAMFTYVFPYFRGYNRISIFIAFFSIAALVIWMQIIANTCQNRKRFDIFFSAILILLLVFSVMDTTNNDSFPQYEAVKDAYPSQDQFLSVMSTSYSYFVPSYDSIKNEYQSDEHFVNQIESIMPEGSMIFQLPPMRFLGDELPNKIYYYDPLKPYLHSNTLRWSYGAMIGRSGDVWQRKVTDQPAEKMIESLAFSGFSGIWVDTYGYENPDQILSDLHHILGTGPRISENNRYYFFDMRAYIEKLKSGMTQEEFEKKHYYTLNPLIPEWGSGFSDYEGVSDLNWRWASSTGELSLINPTRENREIIINTTFFTGWPENANITITTAVFSDQIVANNQGTSYEKKITIPPGRSTISFHCDAVRVHAPSDPRFLVFRLNNFRLYDVSDNQSFLSGLSY